MRTCELTLSFIPTTDNELTLFRFFGTLENWLPTSGLRDRKFDDRTMICMTVMSCFDDTSELTPTKT